MTRYESKIRLNGEYSPETLAGLAAVLEFNPVVLGVKLWECHGSWQVPERKINDNYCCFVNSGALKFTVDGESRVLRRGEFVIIPEFVPHTIELAEDARFSSHYNIHALCENIMKENRFRNFNSPFQRLPSAELFLPQLRALAALSEHNKAAAAAGAAALLKLVFALLAQQKRCCAASQDPVRDPRLLECRRFILQNLAVNIGVDDIARAVGLGESRLRMLFRKELGMSPGDFLTRMRVQYACRQLARYEMPLSQVAAEAGFSSTSYFCTVFRSVTGKTPLEYREYVATCGK